MNEAQDSAPVAASGSPTPPLAPAQTLRAFIPHVGTALSVLAPASFLIAYVNQVGKASALGIPLDLINISLGSIVGVFAGLLFLFYLTGNVVAPFYRWVWRRAKGPGGLAVMYFALLFLLSFPLVVIYTVSNWQEWVWLAGGMAALFVVAFVITVAVSATLHALPGSAAQERFSRARRPSNILDLVERVVGAWVMWGLVAVVIVAGYAYSQGRASALNTRTYFVLSGTPQRALLAIYGDTVILGYVPPKGGSLTHLIITQLSAEPLTGANKDVGPLIVNCNPTVGCH